MSLFSKLHLLSPAVRAAFWFTVCNFIQRGIQFLGMPILTRVMSEASYGTYTVFLSWFNLICIITSLNIYAGTFNVAMVKYAKREDEYTASIQWLTFFTTMAFTIVVVLFRDQISLLTDLDSRTLLLMCANLLLFPSLQYWSQRQRFAFKYRAMIVVTIINSGVGLLVTVIAAIATEGDSTSAIAGMVLVQCVVCLFLFIKQQRIISLSFVRESWKWSLKLSLPLLPHYLAESLLSQADRIMIAIMCGTAKAGIYGITYQISMALVMVRQGFNGAFAPWLYKSLADNKFDAVRKTIKLAIAFMAIFSICFVLVAPEILTLAVPSGYHEAIDAMPPIICGSFFGFIYTLYLYIEIYCEKPKYAAEASIVAASFNVALNLICIPLFGFLSAAYTTMLSYALLAIMHYLFYRRIAKERSEMADLVSTKLVMFSAVAVSGVSMVLLLLYPYPFARYLLLIPVALILISQKNKIASMIQGFRR